MKNSQHDEFTSDATTSPAPQAVGVQAWHTRSFEAVKDRLKTDVLRGLTQSQATRRLAQFGSNALAQAHQRSTLSIFVAQFQSLIVRHDG